eukprot:gnl/MRDRNA2_/MRDRNA2_64271_c0_seq1.p1 gnl/MRDRNA2_/MRDRNA2_64271_c0~~gnl/MRDRNA2_/MRDRNA2_64271_c0_seq1.p1  ORF type:complete len:219 (+),score=36.98 gnl/MRDRNA2_/MRDRNA2_64271_c0_seq1:89-658(+)
MPEEEMDTAIANSAERAFEENRYWYGSNLWQVMQMMFPDEKPRQKKIYNALEEGRKEAWDNARTSGEDYLQTWIAATIKSLVKSCSGHPGAILPGKSAGMLFVTLIEGGALPVSGLIGQEAPRDDWPTVILPALQQAYSGLAPAGRDGGKGKGIHGKGKVNEGFNPYEGKGLGGKGALKGKKKGIWYQW